MIEKKLPDNWNSSPFHSLISSVIGGDWGIDPDTLFNDREYSLAYCIRGSELKNWREEKGKTAALRAIKKGSIEKRELEEGDILLEISGGGPNQPVGRTVIIDKEALSFESHIPKICTNFFRKIRLNPHLDKRYINYYLTHFYNSGEIVNYQGGSNNLRNLKYKEYEQISIPIAPLNEQKRIADTLDNLYLHLDSLNERLDKIPDLLKQFREHVLIQAVTGKLTEEWREANNEGIRDGAELVKQLEQQRLSSSNGKIPRGFSNKTSYVIEEDLIKPKSWHITVIDKIGDVFVGGTPSRKRKDYWDGEISWVSSGEVANCRINHTNELITASGLKNSSAKLYPKGTILLAMIGEGKTRGQSAILDIEACTNQNIAAIVIDVNYIVSEYLWYFLLANYEKNRNIGRGANQPALNSIKVGQLNVVIPPYEEQLEIVKRVSHLFQVAENIEDRFLEMKRKISLLPQTILSKAFMGKLVDQNPEDEPASVLLQKITQMKTK